MKKIAPLLLPPLLAGSLSACEKVDDFQRQELGASQCDDTSPPQKALMRRLTRLEYNLTVLDLLGDDSNPADEMLEDEALTGFTANIQGGVQDLHIEQYAQAASTLAARAPALDPTFLGCEPAEDGCGMSWLSSFSERAFRRPLSDEELARLTALFETELSRSDLEGAVRLTIEALLQAPQFLYRPELGREVEGDRVQLTGFEMASRLSYMLWNRPPDAELMNAAKNGELDSAEGLLNQADRLLSDSRFEQAIESFHDQWLQLERLRRSAKIADNWSSASQAAAEDVLRFAQEIFTTTGGNVSELYDPAQPFAFANWSLNEFYDSDTFWELEEQFTEEELEKELRRIELDPSIRAGVLTSVAFLARNASVERASPVHRGLFIRRHVLCQELAPPPPGIDTSLEESDDGKDRTMREMLELHRESPSCNNCHSKMDPLGLPFEEYDAHGYYVPRREQKEEFGSKVDNSGAITDTLDVDGKVEGAIQMSKHLAVSEEVEQCMGRLWFRYAMGRTETKGEACTIEKAADPLTPRSFAIVDYLRLLIASESFRFAATPDLESSN